MFKQYFKQALQMLKENRLTSVISILGTALSISMILVVVLQFQINLVGFRPESNRDRMLYILGIRADSRDDKNRKSTNMSDGVVKECLYPLQTPEAVTAIARNNAIVSLPDRQLFKEYVIKYTDPGFWKVFDFRFISGKPFTDADFSSGLPRVVIANTLARELFGSEDPIGKDVLIGYVPHTVTGVVEDPTRAAYSAYADVWAPYTSNANYVNGMSCGGVCGSFQGIILARSTSDFESIRTEIKQAVSRYNAAGREFVLGMNFVFSRLDLALGSNDMNGGIRKGWKEYLTKTAPLLLFLLLVPTLNLTGVVQSSVQKRRSEMGLRKAFGATKGRLLVQVLCENLIITLIGGLIGIVLSVVMLQLGKSFLLTKETAVTFEMLFKPVLFAAALFFTLLLNLLSAGLPAIRIAREQIVDALNNK